MECFQPLNIPVLQLLSQRFVSYIYHLIVVFAKAEVLMFSFGVVDKLVVLLFRFWLLIDLFTKNQMKALIHKKFHCFFFDYCSECNPVADMVAKVSLNTSLWRWPCS